MTDAIGPGEAARRLGVSTRTVQRWLRDGHLTGVRVGSRLKVDPRSLPEAASQPPGEQRRRIERLLVANRGELVVRIARTCRELGIRSLALVPTDQAGAWWTRSADEIVPLRGGYLDAAAVIDAAIAARADGIHPGYGFLAESADFAAAVAAAGLSWVGPPAAAMRALGDKASARRLAASLGVPVLDGYDGEDQSDEALTRAAERIGMPLLIKPSAGGGGKGMHVVRDPAELPQQLEIARREARAAFADDRLVLERHVESPRHVEMQVLCDSHGAAVHLGERECSLQRRHQKVIEEAPSPAVTPHLRQALGEAALRLCRAAGYVGAGTAEFLLTPDGGHYFLELNARLQVEHPVTELVTGRDLVADQLRIAAGQPLGFGQAAIRMQGHAIEARLYAEDPDVDFLPATGRVAEVRWPTGEGLRVDAGVGANDDVGTRYDPLLAKLLAHAPDRATALRRLDEALAATAVLGVTTNRGFLRWLLALPEVAEGATDTQLIDARWQPRGDLVPAGAWTAAARALAAVHDDERAGAVRPGFRLNQRPRLRVTIDGLEQPVEIADETRPSTAWVAVGDAVILDCDGRAVRARLAPSPTVEGAERRAAHSASDARLVAAPMPGSVLQVRVSEGDQVVAGQVIVVLEAMKMENAVPAPGAGRVLHVHVQPGQQVQRADPLVELA